MARSISSVRCGDYFFSKSPLTGEAHERFLLPQ